MNGSVRRPKACPATVNVTMPFQKYARLVGVPEGVTPHSARATFITEALEHDHPAEAVQRTVGHASVTTTLAYDKRDHHPRKSASFAVRY